MNDSSNVTIEHPQESKDRRINPTFHTNLVQPYIKNNDILFQKGIPNYTMSLETMRTRNGSLEILAHKWAKNC